MGRQITEKERQHALDAIDLEVANRKRDLEEYLEQQLQTFKDRQEGHLSWLPKNVRDMKMRDFAEKHNGNIQAAASTRTAPPKPPVRDENQDGDKNNRKRKWIASVEADLAESSRSAKNARLSVDVSPGKNPGSSNAPGTTQRTRVGSNVAPGIARMMSRLPGSPSPTKWKPPMTYNSTNSRSNSPTKPPLTKSHSVSNFSTMSRQRVPSTSTFTMALPPKTPVYPPSRNSSIASINARTARKDETLLSVNGSPVVFPPSNDTNGTMKRSKSSIMLRPGSSLAQSIGNLARPSHSRTNSQSDMSFASESQPSTQSTEIYDSQPELQFQPPPSSLPSQLQARTPFKRTTSYSALVAIPTKDGREIQFDPFQTSPGTLEALEGITDSAKRAARDEMGRLMRAAERWKIGQ